LGVFGDDSADSGRVTAMPFSDEDEEEDGKQGLALAWSSMRLFSSPVGVIES